MLDSIVGQSALRAWLLVLYNYKIKSQGTSVIPQVIIYIYTHVDSIRISSNIYNHVSESVLYIDIEKGLHSNEMVAPSYTHVFTRRSAPWNGKPKMLVQ